MSKAENFFLHEGFNSVGQKAGAKQFLPTPMKVLCNLSTIPLQIISKVTRKLRVNIIQQERMWNSFQGDRESGLFWLLSESIEKDYREFFERLQRVFERLQRVFWESKERL